MSILWTVLVVIVTWAFAQYHWSRRHLYLTAINLNGPISLPLIGSTFLFVFCRTEDLLHKIYEMVKKYDNPLGFWLGPKLVVIFKEPQHVEKILSSSKFSHKHYIYNLMKDFLGEGLITASGPEFKLHKKIIQPFFNLQFSEDSIHIFEKHTNICIEKLESFVGQEYFDIGHMIHICIADIIGEAVLGYDFNAQNGENLKYIEAFTNVYKIIFGRMAKPWLHPDVIFYSSKLGKEYKKICYLVDELMQKVIEKSHKRTNSANVTPVIDKVAEHLESSSSSVATRRYWSHLITLYMASQDTIALVASAACLCFGMYPKYQKKVIQEIHDTLEKNQPIRLEDIGKLHYLDMCVKDVLRLFPIAPYILRETIADQQINEVMLPRGCGICIPIYNLHKDPKYWENPNHFHPDHFLPENEKSRPSSSYIPFSAGARGCIGKVFANISVKVVLINLLRRYEIEADGTLPDVKFTMDISLRSLNGYRVKIKRRIN